MHVKKSCETGFYSLPTHLTITSLLQLMVDWDVPYSTLLISGIITLQSSTFQTHTPLHQQSLHEESIHSW